jgi:hypothetical protein
MAFRTDLGCGCILLHIWVLPRNMLCCESSFGRLTVSIELLEYGTMKQGRFRMEQDTMLPENE